MKTREFEHYDGCGLNDPANCGACALTHGGEDGPNYSGWPLAYMENGRIIPAKWRAAFKRELASDNPAYVANLRATMRAYGIKWTDD